MRTSGRIAGWAGRVLLVPRAAWLSARAPRDWRAGWERYWGNVHATGVGGDVLWDSGDLDEVATYCRLAREHLDPALPLVDVGCGNGRFARQLAPLFTRAIGVDVARQAVERARAEAAGQDTLSFRTMDVTAPGAGRSLAAELGEDANVFVRGVFHVLQPADRVAAARNLHALVGSKGRVLVAETNFPGSKLEYLRHLGATPRHIPVPLQRAMANTPAPGHFGTAERLAAFPERDWDVVDDGAVDILTIPLHHGSGTDGSGNDGAVAAEHIPGYYAVLAPAGVRSDGTGT